MKSSLPLIARALLWLVRGAGSEFVVGDVVERHAADLRSGMSAGRAGRRAARQAWSTLWHWWRRGHTARSASVERDWYAARARRGVGMGSIANDFTIAMRNLAKRPGFALSVALTLGLGIGATTTIYSVVDGVLLRPLEYEDPESLVALGTTFPGREWKEGSSTLQHLAGTSMLNFWDLERRARSFGVLGAMEPMSILLTDQGDGPEIVSSAAVTRGFFDVFRTGPVLGRLFSADEFRQRDGGAFLITHGAWQRRFGSDPNILGRRLDNIGLPATIIGVLPPDFEVPEAFLSSTPEFWGAIAEDHARYAERGRRSAFIVGRLADAVTVEQARAETTQIAADLAREFPDGNVYPDGSWFGIGVNGLHEETVGTTGRTLLIFMSASGLLLMLAGLNAATLLLARSLDRARELGVRVALGAGRTSVMGLLVVEAGVLSAIGGMIGVALAFAGVAAFLRLAPTSIPRTDMVAVDARVLAVAALVSLGAGVAAGLLPALRLTTRGPWERLQASGRSVSVPGSRLRTALVGGQVALAVVLLTGAGLLFNSFVAIRSVEPGFEAEGLLSMNVAIKRPNAPPDEAVWQAWETVLAELRAVPGVEALAGASNVPFQSPSWAPRVLLPDDTPGTWREGVAGYSITPDYLGAVGTRLLSGRAFTSADGPDDPTVALVNETFVRTVLDGDDPLGLTLSHAEGDEGTPFTVVGVVEDVVQSRAEEGPRAAVYFPHTQAGWPWVEVVIRSELAVETLVPELRRAVARFNPYVPPRDVRTLEARMRATRTEPRFQTTLIGSFATIAILLAAAGLYGSLSHAVGRRRRELGVRMALGAERAGVLWMVLRQGMRVSVAGSALGVIAAFGSTRVLGGFLYEVEPTDPATFAGVVVLLLLVAAAASVVPARRATGVDPVEVLRAE